MRVAVEPGNAQVLQAIQHRLGAHLLQGLDRGDVQRVGQGFAHRHGAVVPAAVVAVRVQTAAYHFAQRRIVDQGRRGPALFQDEGVDEWLEGRAWLAAHPHCVYGGVSGSASGEGNPCENGTSAMIGCQCRAIAKRPGGELIDARGQYLSNVRLQIGLQGRAQVWLHPVPL